MIDSKGIIKQIDYVLSRWEESSKRAKYNDLSDLGDVHLAELVTIMSDAIERLAPNGSRFRAAAQEAIKNYSPKFLHRAHAPLYGILKALREAYSKDYLSTVQELIHADLFSDFLEITSESCGATQFEQSPFSRSSPVWASIFAHFSVRALDPKS